MQPLCSHMGCENPATLYGPVADPCGYFEYRCDDHDDELAPGQSERIG